MGRRLDVVLVKLGAVVVVVMALQGLANFVGFFANSPQATVVSVAEVLLAFVLPILLAIILWKFPATIIGTYPDTEQDQLPDLAYMAVVLVGLYVLVFGVIDLAYFESFRITERNFVDPDRLGTYSPSPETVAGRFVNLVQIGIGIGILLGKRRISALIRSARSGT